MKDFEHMKFPGKDGSDINKLTPEDEIKELRAKFNLDAKQPVESMLKIPQDWQEWIELTEFFKKEITIAFMVYESTAKPKDLIVADLATKLATAMLPFLEELERKNKELENKLFSRLEKLLKQS